LDLPIDSIAKIRKAFEIDENVGRGMPSLTNRKEKEMSEFDDESASRMVNFAMQSFNALCQVIYPKDPKALALKSSLKVLNHGTGDEDSKLRENARSISMTLPPKSLQRRAILAIIASSYSSNVLRTEFRLGKQLIAEARKEFKFMEQGNVLQQSVRYVESYDKFAVERAVRFILNDANVQRISWGTKKVIIQGEEVDFPKLVRKRVIEYILRGYNEYYLEREDRIGNSSFKKICKVLTSTDAKAKNAVDYVSGRLMYDNFDLIRRIVATHDIELTKLANGLEAFLKSTFEAHIGKCPVSKRNFAFARKGSSTGTCEVCEVPERVMRYFKSWIDPMHASLLDDCTHKIHLYRGHRIRVRNQREAIDELLDGLLLNQALIVLDFKMKFEAMYYREKTTDFYAKKGDSWHGAMAYTRYITPSTEDVQPHHISYYDHISSGDTTQDYQAVLSYFEAVCMRIKSDFPHVRQIYVQSDNARCYKTPELVYGVFEIAKQNGLELLRYIHTGVQDGKGPIDGHFATAMKHVSKYCNMGNNVVTPIDIVKGLRANGGVNNSVAEMVSINRKKINEFVQTNDSVIRKLSCTKNHFEIRYNDVQKSIESYKYSKYPDDFVSISMSPDVNSADEEQKEHGEYEESHDDDAIIEEDLEDDVVVDQDDDLDPNYDGTELNITGRGIVTGCLIYGGQVCRQRQRLNRGIPKIPTPQDIETEDEDPLQCQVCKKSFSHQTNLRQHVCKGAQGRRDLIHYALSYAHKRIDQHEFEITNMRDSDQSTNMFTNVPTIGDVSFEAGWAQIPAHGHMYGRKYIDPFKDDIAAMFQAGLKDKSVRMGAGKMLEKLRQKYSGRLDLPPESEIRQAITVLMVKHRKGQNVSLSSTRGIAQPYLSTVVQIFVESGGRIKPADAWKLFQEKHPAPESESTCYPPMSKIKSKISALKAAYKKSNCLPIIPE